MSDRLPIYELARVDWNFADYSSTQFPTDINSLHWYPAAFVPQIPAILIKSLSRAGELILDPFSGSGTTIIEASRLNRRFIGVDNNPYAVNICRAKFIAIGETNDNWFKEEQETIRGLKPVLDPHSYYKTNNIDPEVFKWFECRTLSEIFALHRHISQQLNTNANIFRRVILSAILNRCCSQRDHYTYITDRCFPKEMLYRSAIKLYCEQLSLISRAVIETRRQFLRVHGREWKPSEDGVVIYRDSRRLTWIKNETIDLIVTSPPYLGVNDYIRSMRLTSLIFPEEGGLDAIDAEIGARRKRFNTKAFDNYISDMRHIFFEISRVLKRTGYLALVIGQGKGRVNKEATMVKLISILQDDHKFKLAFEQERRIKFRRIQVPGIGTERILVFQR